MTSNENIFHRVRRAILSASKQDLVWTNESIAAYVEILLRKMIAENRQGKTDNFLYKLEYELDDIPNLLIRNNIERNNLVLNTEHPVAVESNDRLFAWGTMNDDTRSPRFCKAAEGVFGRNVAFWDLGYSGDISPSDLKGAISP